MNEFEWQVVDHHGQIRAGFNDKNLADDLAAKFESWRVRSAVIIELVGDIMIAASQVYIDNGLLSDTIAELLNIPKYNKQAPRAELGYCRLIIQRAAQTDDPEVG